MLKDIEEYMMKLTADSRSVALELRRLILENGSCFKEELKWSMPSYSCNGLAMYLQAGKGHVNLGFYRGLEMEEADSQGLLSGTGKELRHVRLASLEEVKDMEEELVKLIKAAVILDQGGILK